MENGRRPYSDDENKIVIWNYERGNSVETSARILNRTIASVRSHEKDKCGLCRKGKPRKYKRTQEHCKALSEALRNRTLSPAHRYRLSQAASAREIHKQIRRVLG